MTFVVTQNCCNDATCVDVCPVDCIHPAPGEPGYATAEILHIDPDTCIDCGACAEVCPVDAITADFDLAPNELAFIDLNAEYFRRVADEVPQTAAATESSGPSAAAPAVVRVAIVGTGPSAFYAAEELLSRRDVRVRVTMIERLPFAGGLVRYGVAPDHARTKSIDVDFQRILRNPAVTAYFGVEVGTHLSIEDLRAHHHAVIFASGATADRRLEVPGEDLAGSHSAREFVAWYNGHPDHADRQFDLTHHRVVIVGNGNVALDVARILLSDIDILRRTDIADHALDTLASSAVREVVLLGRRGVAHAACTTPELIGLDNAAGIDVLVEGNVSVGDDPSLRNQLWSTFASRTPNLESRRIVFAFHRTPIEICGTAAVDGIRVRGLAPDDETVIDCGLVLRSIGYRGTSLDGLPFDQSTAVIPNRAGRVTVVDGPVQGLYVTGWIKRGPSGVIGTNRHCARETVAALIEDLHRGELAEPDRDERALRALIGQRSPHHLGTADWLAIDRDERTRGRHQSRPRVKVVAASDVAQVLGRGSQVPV